MAEINRAEELTPEEEQAVETNEESLSQELIPEDGEEKKGLESNEKLGQQVEKGEFNYDKELKKIESRHQERTEGSQEKPGYKSMIKEIFTNERDSKEDGMSEYLKTLLTVRKKVEKIREEKPSLPLEEIHQLLSPEEKLVVALEKKKREIEDERSVAIRELEQKRQEDRKRKIGEI